MPELDDVTPAGGNEAGKKPEEQGNPPADPPKGENPPADPPKPQDGPPPSNAARAEAKAAKEAAEKEAAEKAKAEAEAAAEGEGDEEQGEEELDTSVWGDAGDDVANSVLLTLQNSGISTEDAKAMLWDAVEAGDPTKVDRDALVEKVGKTNATLIMAGIENVTSSNNTKLAEVNKIVHTAAGDEAGWQKAATWARENIPEKELAEYKVMLDKPGKQAEFAAKEIVARYNADPKNTALNAGKGKVEGDSKGAPAVEGISRREYGVQLDKLHRRGIREGHPEFKALQAKRQAGIKQGL